LAGKPALANGSTGVVVVGHGKLLFERESEGGRKREKEREVEKERERERERERKEEQEEEWVRESERGVQRAGGSLLVHPGKTRPHRRPLYVDSTRCLVSPIFFSFSLPLFSIRTRRPL